MTNHSGSFEPLVLCEHSGSYSLLLTELEDKLAIFAERGGDGWIGNGYDWTSIAHVLLDEQLPELVDRIDFDPEADMFCALGAKEDLEQLGKALAGAFHCDDILRDLLSRAELD